MNRDHAIDQKTMFIMKITIITNMSDIFIDVSPKIQRFFITSLMTKSSAINNMIHKCCVAKRTLNVAIKARS